MSKLKLKEMTNLVYSDKIFILNLNFAKQKYKNI